jgi:hypothetical protein
MNSRPFGGRSSESHTVDMNKNVYAYKMGGSKSVLILWHIRIPR